MNYFFWILQVNEDNEPSCSKQQDEGEHTCQPHNYCSRINPVPTQEKHCMRFPGCSSLIVSSSHREVWCNTSTRGFLAILNKNSFFQKIRCSWSELDFQRYQTISAACLGGDRGLAALRAVSSDGGDRGLAALRAVSSDGGDRGLAALRAVSSDGGDRGLAALRAVSSDGGDRGLAALRAVSSDEGDRGLAALRVVSSDRRGQRTGCTESSVQ
ncbi:hypothetical protein AV530_014961 [Patagioenas fasciata monilis]|uniref:Uncharacterized protein n=1 Tax=Patagioenas fasciata monilis TaxID=372326 RepID=A0A1V4K0G4_PATFA|nr:hypothetical protein AV530_014961 [Patagioenas fasciata monilis]